MLNRINLTRSHAVPIAVHQPAPKPMANANARRPKTPMLSRMSIYCTAIATERHQGMALKVRAIMGDVKIILGLLAWPASPANGLLPPVDHRNRI